MSRKEAPVEKTGNQSAERWIEVVHPLADVMKMLAALIEQSPADLTGASIAVTDRGTLLLNQSAWTLFAPALQPLSGLTTRSFTLRDSNPVRFLLESGGVAKSQKPGTDA